MAGYLVLARKYRSATFDEVVGQEPIARTLKSAIQSDRLAHAYLFTGTRGVGKTTMARILAKAVNCLSVDEPTPTPCNTCDACVSIARGDDVDVVEIDGASNRGIDEIRQLRANAILRPARSRCKIYYIDEVHMLTKEAFNALLKTLEEPPEHVKFIFSTTEVEKVPPTIVSRCQRFDFRDIPTRLIAEHLARICQAEKVEADEDALFRIARAATGSMRDGLSLLDQLLAGGSKKIVEEDVVAVLGRPSDERTIAIAQAIADGDAATALAELAAVLASGVTLPTAAGALGDAFRNAMIAATCGSDSELIELPEAQRKAVGELGGRFDVPALVGAVAMLQSAARSVRFSSMGRAALEAVVVRLAQAEKFISADTVLSRLERSAASNTTSTGQKKKLAPGGAGGRPAAARVKASPRPNERKGEADRPSPPIQWTGAWLAENWKAVLDALVARRQMQIAGLLRVASVLSYDDGLLRLGYDRSTEPLRARCAGPLCATICSALTELAGRSIRCEFVGAEGAGGEGSTPAVRPQVLSTEEKNEIHKDPAVQSVLERFGGQVVDMRIQTPPRAPHDSQET